jgi:hypothetical protein
MHGDYDLAVVAFGQRAQQCGELRSERAAAMQSSTEVQIESSAMHETQCASGNAALS